MFKQTIIMTALASALAIAPQLSLAAGLGKITVLSGLGQPLRAELELSASREELVGMAARLAPREAFQQAGVDYAAPLSDLRFAIDKRPDGKAVIKIMSARPVNEPFLDFLVELNWSAGRLVREYTFLLDPPEIVVKGGRVAPTVDARQVDNLPGGGEVPEPRVRPAPAEVPKAAAAPVPESTKPAPESRAKEKAAEKQVEKRAEKPAEKAAAPAGEATHAVQKGETLALIAARNKPEGVSLEQMLIGLYNANQDAFVGRNMNRLKAGAILNLPTPSEIDATPADEARRLVLAQSNDWNAYRRKLAAAATQAPAKQEAVSQSNAGKITPKVEDKAPTPEAAKDQVKVSRTEQAGKNERLAGALEEERVAHDRAMREARDRMASLEKNVADLQKLLEMKNQKLATLEQSQNKAPEPAPVPPPPPKVTEAAPLPPVPPKAVEPPPEAKAPEVKPAVVPPAPPAKPEAEAPKPVAVPKAAEPEADGEIGLLDSLPELALPVAGGGLLALLAGLFYLRRRRDKAEERELDGMSTLTTLPESSIFQAGGGQQVDTANTANTPPPTGEFSQTGPGTIDTDEVDPVAEADVYMAYGRDAQAEEILIEALNKDPKRLAIHLKLLEIYHGRKATKQFEGVATELYAVTGGQGGEWEKAAAMGAAIDPLNPLYGRSAPPVAPAPQVQPVVEEPVVAGAAVAEEIDTGTSDFERTDVLGNAARLEEDDDRTLLVDHEDLEFSMPTAGKPEPDFAAASSPLAPAAAQDEQESAGDAVLDFDLDSLSAPEPVEPAALETLEFTLDALPPAEAAVPAPTPAITPEATFEAVDTSAEDDFTAAVDFDASPLPEPLAAAAGDDVLEPASSIISSPLDVGALGEPGMPEFDTAFTESMVLDEEAKPTFDISSISLDLAAEQPAVIEEELPAAVPELDPDATLVDELSPEELAVIEEIRAAEVAAANEAPVYDEALREEVNTKLDLAKAYEEMGDLDGARELLGEVVSEGPPDLAEQAREILGRIGS